MDARKVPGCCAAKVLFNLGGSHGFPRAESQYEFDSWIAKKQLEWADIVIAITDQNQTEERYYLDTIGFRSEDIGGLLLHTIPASKLRIYIERHRQKPKEFVPKKARRFDW